MTESTENKYKLFRQYMTNELGITRTDIEAWVKEAVSAEVQKLLGQINIERRVEIEVNSAVRNLFTASYGRPTDKVMELIQAAFLAEISGQVEVRVKPKPKQD